VRKVVARLVADMLIVAIVLCAVIPLTIVLWRLRMEEQVLRRELPGYSEYTRRVRHRLIPGVW